MLELRRVLVRFALGCRVMLMLVFKLMTAYEMRISDWSSDVCSSDLIFMFSNVDRYVISVLVQPIKAELALSDLQIGLLTGFAFSKIGRAPCRERVCQYV